MLHTHFIGIGLLVLEEKIFKGFYHIWAWQPSWSFDLHHLYQFSLLCSHELPHSIRFQITQQFFRRKRRSKFENRATISQGQRMALTFDTHGASFDHLVQCIS